MFSKRFGRKYVKKQHPDDVKGFKISTSQKMYSPFELQDTRYLEHLKHHMKLREAHEGSLLRRNELLESNKRVNYLNEIDRLLNTLHKPNLPHSTIEHMKKRADELDKMSKDLLNPKQVEARLDLLKNEIKDVEKSQT